MPKPLLLLFGLCVGAMLATTDMAQAQQLGASSKRVEARYPQARRVRLADGSQALELNEVDYAGLHWGKVDFVFNSADHLVRLSLETRQAPFERILAVAETQAHAPSGLLQAEDASGPEMQLRICEGEDGAVTLTYERSDTYA